MRWIKLLTVCLALLFAVQVRAAEEGPLEDDLALSFTLKTLEGKPYGLKNALGGKRSALLYFCATWCKDCKAVMPQVKEITPKYAGRINVLAINTALRDSLKAAIEYKQKNNLPYPVVFDDRNEVSDSYMVLGFPLFVLVNPQGIIKYRGSQLPPDLERFLK